MRLPRRALIGLCLVLTPVGLTGCSNSQDTAASARANHFYRALASKDAAAACADLAAKARQSLEQEEGKPCVRVILDQHLPTPSGNSRVRTYGSAAQVRHSGDTAFLSRYDSGWLITGVGCKPTGHGEPYDCTIEVG